MDTNEYLPMFLAECREHLQELNLAVVRLEEDPHDRGTVDEIFRAAHSLKGMAATMGFEGMARLTHQMEDVFELLRQRDGALTSEVTDVVLACLDALETATDGIEADGSESLDPAELITRLQGLVRDSDGSEDAPAEEPAAAAPVLAPIDADGTVLEVTVGLAEDCQMAAVRAYMVLAAIGEHGTIVQSAPADADVDGFTGSEIHALVATQAEADVLSAAIRAVPDVGSVAVAVPAPPQAEEPEPGKVVNAAERRATSAGGSSRGASTVRVDAERLDQLMHLMGELVVQRTLVEGLAADVDVPGLSQAMQGLTRSSHELQAMVMQIRMIPVEAVFLRFPRLVRDASSKLGKQVDLQLVGQETELDRTVVDALGDPLVHLIRNALDHGLEPPAERLAAGKEATGTLTIAARHAGGSIVISVKDDGRGVDPAKVAAKAVQRGLITAEQAATVDVRAAIELLFAPGFSTAETVGDLSGRGVGMDAVREKIRQLGGEVVVTSVPGEGTEAEVRLPLTLAIMSALLVEADGRPYGIPLQRVERTLRLDDLPVRGVAGKKMLVQQDGPSLPLLSARDVFGHDSEEAADDTHVVIIRGSERSIALSVSGLVGQRELVTRPLPQGVAPRAAVSGAAVLPDGSIVLLADCDAVISSTSTTTATAGRPSLTAVA
ncbi:chemotaxis protein CheA [Conexibacter sp. SYSU D00693]|uniref:chemotaxis protein CheA n=1 Tax=Conexibacter sp. SYSU D00693 TaxID=2812560 RepID=UPI00196B2F2A|nr:chemotaxis protein CheA [Conexibacter sp. SYSU D00693]